MSLKLSPLIFVIIIFILNLFFLNEDIPIWILFLSGLIVVTRAIVPNIPNWLINISLAFFSWSIILKDGFSLNAEKALSFFLLMTAHKIIQIKNERDFFIAILVSILCLVGTGLFSKSIGMLLYLSFALILLLSFIGIKDFSKANLETFNNFKKSLFLVLIASPIAISLFIFFPRVKSFLPSVGGALQGKIGHAKEIRNDQISSLGTSSEIAFRATVTKKININQLYWRGRVLNQTDGYNWKVRKSKLKKTKKVNLKGIPFKQEIKLEQDFKGDLFILDTPLKIFTPNYNIDRSFDHVGMYFVNARDNKIRYQAYSIIGGEFSLDNQREGFVQIPKKIKGELLKLLTIKKESLSLTSLNSTFSEFFNKRGFTYTLNPGQMKTLKEFLSLKKGFCSHFASLTALILRANDIPSRLVNGFHGGQFNRFNNQYLISLNDAHVWVEVLINNKWNRIDPTLFVAQDRLLLGGERYFNPYPFSFFFRKKGDFSFLKSELYQRYTDIKMYYDNLDVAFNNFLESFTKAYQKALASKLGLDLYVFYSLAIWLPLICFIFYYLYQYFKRDAIKVDPVVLVVRSLIQKLKKYNVHIAPSETLLQMQQKASTIPPQKISLLDQIFEDLINKKYRDRDVNLKDLKAKIKQL